MRGRKPVPTSLKMLRGNPGKRALNHAEPKHDAIDKTCPTQLKTEGARAEWARVIDTLSQGHVTTVDRAALMAYCRKFDQWARLEEEAEQHPFVVKAPSGYPIPNPALGMANKACSLMLKLASELGITPSSRSRIALAPDWESSSAVDEFTAFQRRRRTGA